MPCSDSCDLARADSGNELVDRHDLDAIPVRISKIDLAAQESLLDVHVELPGECFNLREHQTDGRVRSDFIIALGQNQTKVPSGKHRLAAAPTRSSRVFEVNIEPKALIPRGSFDRVSDLEDWRECFLCHAAHPNRSSSIIDIPDLHFPTCRSRFARCGTMKHGRSWRSSVLLSEDLPPATILLRSLRNGRRYQ